MEHTPASQITRSIFTPSRCIAVLRPVNSASGGSAVAPGSLISIYGTFQIAAGEATTLPLPTSTYSGYYLTSATGGSPLTATRLPLLYWGPSQINSVLTVPATELALWGPGGGRRLSRAIITDSGYALI